MSTALDLITDALVGMGVYAPGETISDADAEWSLRRLNVMTDSWSTESLTCYQILEQSVALVASQPSYTIGPGGNINATRPLRINNGPGSAYSQDAIGNNFPIEVITRAEWNQIGNRSGTFVNSNIPEKLWYDPQYPLGVINIWPVYNGLMGNPPLTLFFDSYLQLTDFANLVSPLSLPPGYEKAFADNLMVDAQMISAFKPDGFQTPQSWIASAKESKWNVKRTNFRDDHLIYDPELSPRASATWNIYRDSYVFAMGCIVSALYVMGVLLC